LDDIVLVNLKKIRMESLSGRIVNKLVGFIERAESILYGPEIYS
jgi:hypothetical protein